MDPSAHAERGELLWRPSPDRIERANLTAFMRRVEAERGLEFGGEYDALWRWSVESLDEFWATVWDEFGVIASSPRRDGCSRAARCRAPSGSPAPG